VRIIIFFPGDSLFTYTTAKKKFQNPCSTNSQSGLPTRIFLTLATSGVKTGSEPESRMQWKLPVRFGDQL